MTGERRVRVGGSVGARQLGALRANKGLAAATISGVMATILAMAGAALGQTGYQKPPGRC